MNVVVLRCGGQCICLATIVTCYSMQLLCSLFSWSGSKEKYHTIKLNKLEGGLLSMGKGLGEGVIFPYFYQS